MPEGRLRDGILGKTRSVVSVGSAGPVSRTEGPEMHEPRYECGAW